MFFATLLSMNSSAYSYLQQTIYMLITQIYFLDHVVAANTLLIRYVYGRLNNRTKRLKAF